MPFKPDSKMREIIVLTLLLCSVGIAQITRAETPSTTVQQFEFDKQKELQEEQACQKLIDRLNIEFNEPAEIAVRKRQYSIAIKLFKKTAEQWQATEWKYDWAKQVRHVKIIDSLVASAHCYERMHLFDKEAECYKNCDYVVEAIHALRKDKNFADAEKLCKQSIDSGNFKPSYPVYLDLHVLLAEILQDEGKSPEAEGVLTALLKAGNADQNLQQIRSARIALADLYKNENRTMDFEKVKADLDCKKCPLCKSDSAVVPIEYGLTKGSTLNAHSGGCMSSQYSPQWWCNDDKSSF
ncbi:MAG: hypothetical protein K2X81_05610 [Candidatus Obscuribacterales bacterium]|nr:hypothetical protein [Candidatus Obscuribacterales bacterium]